MRVDGLLRAMNAPSGIPPQALISRVKILAGLNIADAGCRRMARRVSASAAPNSTFRVAAHHADAAFRKRRDPPAAARTAACWKMSKSRPRAQG